MDALDVLQLLLDGLAVGSSWLLRVRAVHFVRWLPWPPTALHNIYASLTAYLAALALNWSCWALGWTGRSQKTPASENNPLASLYVFLAGTFSPHRPRASTLAAACNVLCALAVLDFVYRGELLHDNASLAFSRVGYVNGTHARIAVRAPGGGAVQMRYWRETSSSTDGEVHTGQTLVAREDDDFVLTFALDGLMPESAYSYATNASHAGAFHTPAMSPTRWSFVSSSCILPFFPYSPFDHSLRIRGLERLSTYLSHRPASIPGVDFMLFLGDFIYIDLPLRFGATPAHYRRAYRQVYGSPSWTPALRRLPWLHAYDDHEITNDWSGGEDGLYPAAIESYVRYQHAANPPPAGSSAGEGEMYYSFSRGDVDFFVLDTRRYRSPAGMADGPGKTMLGARQRGALEAWLAQGEGWKVVVSSVPFTRNFRGKSAGDSWAGYLWERERLLEAMWATPGVVIISGDRHEHATTTFPAPGTPANASTVFEFSTSPLNQFYPGAAAQRYAQVEASDVAVHYEPAGQSKFAVFTFDTAGACEWRMGFELVVDGVRRWGFEVRRRGRGCGGG